MSAPSYLEVLDTRTVVFDGAMGTNIQSNSLPPGAFGESKLEGCLDHLVLSSPNLIQEIHTSFLDVGCDVLETNTFRANRFALKEYGLQGQVSELNRAAAQLAKEVAADFSTPARPRFVAGSMGPSGFLPSSSDPDLGRVTFEELAECYREQAGALLRGGVDLLLVETGQDILEVKASVTGARRAMAEEGLAVPLQVQVTLDTSGRMLLGTNMPSAMVTLEALKVDVLGLNCSTGPEQMRGPVRFLSEHGRTPISVIPNAGIPHNLGGEAIYPLTPDELAGAHREFVEELGVSVVGGCCGTTPEHMEAVVHGVGGLGRAARPSGHKAPRISSAVRALEIRQTPAPTLIGERVNSQGSRRVRELLLDNDYEELLQVARQQVESGAHVLDVCVALTERSDEAHQMKTLVKLLSQGVEAPLMVDTTEVDVAVAALQQIPGRAILNSVHLEGGREKLDRVLPHTLEHGAALIALTIDEEGMAKTAARKLEVAEKIRAICVDEHGMEPSDLIFDVLTFTLATGEEEYRKSALETLEGIRRIKAEIPRALTSLGVSNVSFGLHPQARPVLNSVFLHHAVEAGLDMAILNPANITPFLEIEEEARELAGDLVLDRRPDALARFISFFEGQESGPAVPLDPRATMTAVEAIHWMILHRRRDGIEERVDEAVQAHGGGHEGAVRTLNQVLLPAMKEVGDRFGAGDLILPFVLQSAEVMKLAVGHLEKSLDRMEGQSKGTVVLATVFGDVHDIGKNLVQTILENNGYTVHNLGKQVPINTILRKAEELEADAIGLSALLVSTSKQMPLLIQELHRRKLDLPVLLGGAAVNPSFVRHAAEVGEGGSELYPHGVFYCKDAFDGLSVMDAVMDREGRGEFLEKWAQGVRKKNARHDALVEKAVALRPTTRRLPPSRDVQAPQPPFWGAKVLENLPLPELFPLIDRNTLFRLDWGARNTKGEAFDKLVEEEFEPRLHRFQQEACSAGWFQVRGAYGYFPAAAEGDDLLLFDPGDPRREVGRYSFPRQHGREELCLSDFFQPLGTRAGGPGNPTNGGSDPSLPSDTVALQIVSVRSRLLEEATDTFSEGGYSEGYFLHGFGVRLAEAGAEFLHHRIRRELGVEKDRGLRFSWGYGACPDTRQHRTVFNLLPARERLEMDLTQAGALVPELSTAALVVHHPEARYFSV